MSIRKTTLLGAATLLLAAAPGVTHASTSILNFETTQTTTPFQVTLSGATSALASVGAAGVMTTFEGPTDGSVADGSTAPTGLLFPAITQTVPASLIGGSEYVPFTGGSFDFAAGGLTLLSGTFQSALFQYNPGSTAAALKSVNVTYTGGSYLKAYDAATGATAPTGDFSLSFSGLTTPPSVSAGVLQPFSASTGGTTGTFDISPNAQPAVPEAGSGGLLAFGGLALIGLSLRARRRRPAAA